MLKESWETRIQRAECLAATNEVTRHLLRFYGSLLCAQRDLYRSLLDRGGWRPTGRLEQDLPELDLIVPSLLRVVQANGPSILAEEAKVLLQAGKGLIHEMLLEHWFQPSDLSFFAKAILQPYALSLVESGTSRWAHAADGSENRCPFCGGRPQLAVLHGRGDSPESGNRDLMCSSCLSLWPYRRVVCASCGEERPRQLAYYKSTDYGHVRIEACDTCRRYLKAIDLTQFGLAVPLVDEVAAAALDLWARDYGYAKIELNLVGL